MARSISIEEEKIGFVVFRSQSRTLLNWHLTFCRARLLTKLALGTILTAYSLLVSNDVTLYTFANPPFPNNLPRKYVCTVNPSPQGRFLCSTIVTCSEDEEVGDLLTTVVVLLVAFFSKGASDDWTMFGCWWILDEAANGFFFVIGGSFVVVPDSIMTFRKVSLDKLVNALFASPPPMDDMVSLPVTLAVVAADCWRCNKLLDLVDVVTSFFDGKRTFDAFEEAPAITPWFWFSILTLRWLSGALLLLLLLRVALFILNEDGGGGRRPTSWQLAFHEVSWMWLLWLKLLHPTMEWLPRPNQLAFEDIMELTGCLTIISYNGMEWWHINLKNMKEVEWVLPFGGRRLSPCHGESVGGRCVVDFFCETWCCLWVWCRWRQVRWMDVGSSPRQSLVGKGLK